MSNAQLNTTVLESELVEPNPLLTIVVKRKGHATDRCLVFNLPKHSIDDEEVRYNIGHIVGLDTTVRARPVITAHTVEVCFKHSQLIDERLLTRISQAIGNAMHFNPGDVAVQIKTL